MCTYITIIPNNCIFETTQNCHIFVSFPIFVDRTSASGCIIGRLLMAVEYDNSFSYIFSLLNAITFPSGYASRILHFCRELQNAIIHNHAVYEYCRILFKFCGDSRSQRLLLYRTLSALYAVHARTVYPFCVLMRYGRLLFRAAHIVRNVCKMNIKKAWVSRYKTHGLLR
jgi:hypothetical protein